LPKCKLNVFNSRRVYNDYINYLKDKIMNKKVIAWIVAIVIVIGAIFAFGGEQKDDQVLKIGLIGPFSGNYASVGETFRNGALLAVEEIKAKNPDKKVELIVEDGAFDPGKSLSAYKKLKSIDHINALIAVDTITIDSIYNDVIADGMPVINGGEQSLDPKNDNVLQIYPGNYASEVAMGKEIKNDGKQKVVMVTGNHAVFARFSKGVKEGYQGNIDEFVVNFGEQDIRTFALKIKALNPDAVALVITPDLMARFLKTFNELGMKNVSYYFDCDLQNGWESAIKIANPEMFNGSKVVVVGNFNEPSFVASYTKRFGNSNILTGNVGYDAVNLLYKNYSSDNSKWMSNILKSNSSGVSGKIEFDSVGVRKPEFKIGVIENGMLPK
jgi:branched-chain amino acid transport system substrate-binding protein